MLENLLKIFKSIDYRYPLYYFDLTLTLDKTSFKEDSEDKSPFTTMCQIEEYGSAIKLVRKLLGYSSVFEDSKRFVVTRKGYLIAEQFFDARDLKSRNVSKVNCANLSIDANIEQLSSLEVISSNQSKVPDKEMPVLTISYIDGSKQSIKTEELPLLYIPEIREKYK